MFKKILAACIAVMIALSSINCLAVTEDTSGERYRLLAEDNFSGYGANASLKKGGKWDFVQTVDQYGRLIARKSKSDGYLDMDMKEGKSAEIYFGKRGFNLSRYAAISFRVRFTGSERLDFAVEFDSYKRQNLLRFSGGKITSVQGREAGTYLNGEWIHVSLIFPEEGVKVMINGKETNIPNNVDIRMLGDLYFIARNHGSTAKISIDDIQIFHYAADAPVKASQEVPSDPDMLIINNRMAGKYAFISGAASAYTPEGPAMYVPGDWNVRAYMMGESLMIPAQWLSARTGTEFDAGDIVTAGETAYISLDKAAKLLGRAAYYDPECKYWMMGAAVDPFSPDELTLKRDMAYRMKYTRPTGSRIIQDMYGRLENMAFESIEDDEFADEQADEESEAEAANQGHPRIMATSSDFARVSKLVKTDPVAKEWFEAMRAYADKLLAAPLVFSGSQYFVVMKLGLLYQVTGDEKYAQGVWKYLENAVNLPDWKPGNTVETGNYALMVSVGYDWCYDYLDENQKQLVKNAVFEKALNLADAVYQKQPAGKMVTWWPNCDHNWNFVCNGAFSVAALTFTEENEEMCARILTSAMKGLERGLESFGQNGGWNEGPMYWGYGTSFLFNLIETLESTTGSHYGYMNPTVTQTSLFPIYMSGNRGTFNFSDSTEGYPASQEIMYSAHASGNGNYARIRIDAMKKFKLEPMAEDLIFYDPNITPEKADLSLDGYFDKVETATFRDHWNDSEGIYVGIHGGINNSNHGDLDIGTFVLDALGQRFFSDLGPDSYSLPNYNGRGVGGGRWRYYKKRAEGSNTLVINPTLAEDQDSTAKGLVTKFVSAPAGGYAVMDMTAAYRDANSAKRGIMLYDNRSRVLIQDELSLKKPSKVYWFAHTLADIELSEDGKSAVLTLNGKKLQANILGPQNAAFTVMNAVPMPTSPQVKQANTAPMQKLTIEMNAVTQARISVSLIPLQDGKPVDKLPNAASLDKWYISDQELPDTGITAITVNGEAIPEFDVNRANYRREISSSAIPKVDIAGESTLYNYSVTQTSDILAPAVAAITDKNGNTVRKYTIFFSRVSLPAVSVESSKGSEKQHAKENALDGSVATYWSSEGDNEWILLEFEKPVRINQAAIAWYKARKSTFDIELSVDKTNWQKVYSGVSSGTTKYAETYEFPAAEAKYIRINCHGANNSTWNAITEIQVYSE